jgi:hypothetical protein
MIDRILPIHRMACPRGMGVMRLLGNTQPTRPARAAGSAEVLENIKALL